MTVSPGDILRVTAKMQYPSADVQNVYHLKVSGTGSESDGDVYDAIATWMDGAYDYIDNYLSTGLDFATIEAVNLTQDTKLGEEAWPTLVQGAVSANQAYATQVAALALFNTATLRSQGRKFIGGLQEGIVGDGGELDTTFLTGVANYAAELLAGVTVGGLTLTPGNWNQNLARFVAWISAVIISRAATQRRRRANVGS